MAINYSQNQHKIAYRIAIGKNYPKGGNSFFNKVFHFFLTKLFDVKWSIFNLKQSLLQKFYKEKNDFFNINFELNKKTDLTKNSNELNDKGYTFVRNFFDEDTYNILLKNFPTFTNFEHTKKITKNYLICYWYYHTMKFQDIKNIKYNNEYNSFIKHLASEKFILDLENLIFKDKENYTLKNFLCSYKNEGSYLIPHMDSIYYQTKKTSYNFIYFLDGKNEFPEFSAATGIYADNDFKEPLLIPDDLKNSCLIYKTSNTNKFFHGFDRVKADGFAKVCTFLYAHEDIK